MPGRIDFGRSVTVLDRLARRPEPDTDFRTTRPARDGGRRPPCNLEASTPPTHLDPFENPYFPGRSRPRSLLLYAYATLSSLVQFPQLSPSESRWPVPYAFDEEERSEVGVEADTANLIVEFGTPFGDPRRRHCSPVQGVEDVPTPALVGDAKPTKSATVGGQSAKALVVDEPLDFVFVSEGEPMKIQPNGGGPALMQVQFTRGRSAVDTEEPSKIVVYAHPFLWLTKNPSPVPGFPEFVRRVRPRDGKIHVEIVFGRWSNLFEVACTAHWMRRNANLLAAERKTRGIEGLEVVVKRPPVIELFIALQDRLTGLTLAHAQQNILRGSDELTYLFTFEPAAYDAFLRAEREGDLVIQPIWRARMREFKLGAMRVDATINLKQTVEEKLASEGLQVDGPIDQLTFDKITREILSEMKTTIATDHPDVLPLLKTNLLLMEGVLKSDGWMTLDDVRKARGPDADQILAEHLAPHGLTLLKDKITHEDKTTTTGNQRTTRGGRGFGLSLPYFGLSRLSDKESRDINLITKVTGVEFQEGETKNTFAPHRIKRYRTAEGKDDRGMHQTFVIQVGGQNGFHYYAGRKVGQALSLTRLHCQAESLTYLRIFLAGVILQGHSRPFHARCECRRGVAPRDDYRREDPCGTDGQEGHARIQA